MPHQKLLQKLKGLRLDDVLTKWIERAIFVWKTDASSCKWQFLQLDRCNQRSSTGICVRTTVILDICQRLVRLGLKQYLTFADDTKIWTKMKDTPHSGSEYVNGMVEAMVTCLQHGKV